MTSVAGRIQMIQELLHMPIEDESGNVVGHTSLITPEEGRKLLKLLLDELPGSHGVVK